MRQLFACLFLLVAVAAVGTNAAQGHSHTIGSLTIEHPWARATAGAARNGAAYMVITNSGMETDQLVSAQSPVAETVELHTHLLENGVMRMRPVSAIEVNVGEPAVLKPGGLHIMLIGLKAPLKEGEMFPLTLTFAKAGTTTVEVLVEAAGSLGQLPHGDSGHKH